MAYSVQEAARVLSIGTTKLHELLASGELPSFNIGRRRLVSAADLESFVERRRLAAQRRV